MSQANKSNNVGKNAKKTKKRRGKARARVIVAPTKMFETPKQMKADPRMGGNGVTKAIELGNQTDVIIMPVSLDNRNLEDWAAAYVIKAMEKGFQAAADTDFQPYYAYVYLSQAMQNLVSNKTISASNLPYCVSAMVQALQRKTVVMGNGRIDYVTTLSDDITEATISHDIGFIPYGYTWQIGFADLTLPLINGFPQVQLAGSAYTDELGATAFQRLSQILATDKDANNGPNRPVFIADRTSLRYDVSAFAIARSGYNRIGLGTRGADFGGFSYTLDLEVPIRRPILGAIQAAEFSPGQVNRYGNLHANACGDGMFLGGSMSAWLPESHWKLSRPPRLHCVDFLEFADVIGKWVSAVIQTSYSDQSNAKLPSERSCPLTLQETMLLFRNVCMQQFKDTQCSVQGTYPVAPSSDTDNQFVPFVASGSTCYLASVDMSLPIPLIENLRSLTARFVHRGGNDYEWFVPVLGKFNADVLNTADYTYIDNEDVSHESFRSPSTVFARRILNKSGGKSFTPMVETVINLVDGSCTPGFAAINDGAQLARLSSQWNDWLNVSGMGDYSVTLGKPSKEAGINALVSVNMTRHWVDIPASRKILEMKRDIVDVRLEEKRNHRLFSSPYVDREAVADSAQSKIVATAYEQIQSKWILPVIKQQLYLAGPYPTDTLDPRWQAIMSEPFQAPLAANSTGVKLNDMHSIYASMLVKTKLKDKTDLILLLDELARTGRGGILSGLVAQFADAIVPGAGNVVRTIGGVIGV